MSYKPKKHIALVGMMGSGKTTLGGILAKQLGVDFIDSDRQLELQANATIAEIFERDGEEKFRLAEQNFICDILQNNKTPFVLATGGGAFLNAQTRQICKKYATTIWLRADFDTIYERVKLNPKRPLLQKPNKEQIIKQLIKEREPFYKKADIVVDSLGSNPYLRVENIINELKDV